MICMSKSRGLIHAAFRLMIGSILTSLMMISQAKSLTAADLIYVTLTDSTVSTFDLSSGNPVTITASKSILASGLSGPYGLRFDHGGSLFQASIGTNIINKISPGGGVTPFVTGLDGPTGLDFDTSGFLYAANSGNGTISKISTTGTVTTFATGLTNPYGIAFDIDDYLYVANHNVGTISKISPAGTVSTFATGLSLPFDLAFDNAGFLYVSNSSNGTISKINSAGVVTTHISGLVTPRGLAFDSSGYLYVADGGPNSISKFDQNGNLLFSFTTGAAPMMITFQPVPEPASLLLSGLSAGLVGFLVRRRRASRIDNSTTTMD